MMDAMNIAASGMQAAMRSFGAHAANIANADSAAQESSKPDPGKPGGIYQPTAIVQGMLPNIDIASEVVGTIQAAASFRANLAVFESSARLHKALLDTVA